MPLTATISKPRWPRHSSNQGNTGSGSACSCRRLVRDFLNRLVSLVRVLCQTPAHDSLQVVRRYRYQIFNLLRLRVPVSRNHDVLGFQITMNDAGGVSLCQTLSHLLQISQELSEFGSLPINLFAQREAVDILHRNEMHTLVLADFVDVRDVRMIER